VENMIGQGRMACDRRDFLYSLSSFQVAQQKYNLLPKRQLGLHIIY